jgi:pimeloyl-ACP methyl ester carboxylesterase
VAWWLIVVLAVLALVVAGWAHHAYWTRRYRVVTGYAEHHRVKTPDGSTFELRRLGAPDTRDLPPVILVHGLATSHRNHDLDPDFSLARHLEAAGRDVWLLTLRSGRADLRRAEAKRMRFEAMVRYDIPLAIEQVLDRTRADAVDYVGFSMGGMLLYSAIERTLPAAKLRRVALVGSPGRVELPWRWLRIFRKLPRWIMPALWLGIGARMYAFMADWFPTPVHRMIYNPRNVDRGKAPIAMVNALADVPAELHADFAEWALGDGVIRIDGEPVLDRLEVVSVPAIFFAGGGDRIAPAHAVRAAFDRWGSEADPQPLKEFRLLARAAGHREDYGHGDMVIGRHVRADIFEPLAEFLARD